MKLTFIFTCLICIHAYAVKPLVVYGPDNRQDLYQVQNPRIHELSLSIAGMIQNKFLTGLPDGKIQIESLPYGKRHNLCTDSTFYDQPAAINCTGFLVGPDLLATAGHCAQDHLCTMVSFIFDFDLKTQNQNPTLLSSDQVYRCRRVIAQEKNEQVDFGIIQLDRPVQGRPILKLSTTTQLQENSKVFTLGYPAGLPLKLTDEGRVRKVSPENNFYVTDLDSFGANSGSPLFDASTYEVAGIIVRGEADFEWDSVKNCRSIKYCKQDECRGEDATHIRFAAEALQSLQQKQSDQIIPTGIGGMMGCSVSLIDTGKPDQPAQVITNGHCVGRIPPGENWVNVKKVKEVTFLSPTERQPVSFSTKQILWATMTGTDLALVELDVLLKDLFTFGIQPLKISNRSEVPQNVQMIYFDKKPRSMSCAITDQVSILKESRWEWKNVYRHTCQTWGGTSGSPLINSQGEIVSLHNTQNENGQKCTENNPCEVDSEGRESVIPGQAYGQNLSPLANY